MKAGKKDSTYFDGENILFSVKDNRTTTAASLQAAVCLLFATDKEQYCKFYRLATHDDCGAGSWYYVTRETKSINSKNTYKRKRDLFKIMP